MKRLALAAVTVASLAAFSGNSATAGSSVRFNVNVGAPCYYNGPPVVYRTPMPVYYAPRPCFYGPTISVGYRSGNWGFGYYGY
ncbi:MAG: hypothetical protein K1X53_10775 [Candidatus Sumerlaeaceae bacterium]|nr:hypothetical protein [Candidatus Sumerlaeaceae bacterium]